ncbi:uncharacterized protein LOC105248602 [Camponotus floridanus]|uniref:uncharacterized protein LOC105248602 n=1 Tax=Camponotus floridanus TaxID=104421 RepID=UPI000DC668E8|nr:uncharacterized protein LOC105248602 [Camponotus floridanus]
MDHSFYFYDSQYQNDFNELNNEDDSQNEKENSYGIDQNGIDGDALLISLVRNYPYLYNKELTDFKDIIKKQNAWTEIGNILNMTADECQSRWTRLRERYAREKKQKQEETTTGSGASKRKSFEFFENMQFLERFVKRRRTISNVYKKNIPPSTKCINLQKNFGSRGGENSTSSMIESTFILPSSKDSSEKTNLSSKDSSEKTDSEKNIIKIQMIAQIIPLHQY